jgi:CDP-glycerol glycerophosphotransferase (TagB/SpsB family)
MKKLVKTPLALLRLLVLYPLSFLFPRSKNVWVFGASRGQFYDNAKYLLLWITIYRPGIRPVWIGVDRSQCDYLRSQGVEAYPRRSLRGIFFRTRAKVYIYSSYLSDIGISFSGGALRVNLWHGVGIKKIEFLIDRGPLTKIFNPSIFNINRLLKPDVFMRPHLMLTPSIMMAEHFKKAFRIDDARCIPAGYPRNEIGKDDELKSLALQFGAYQGFRELKSSKRRIMLYMPTWRDAGARMLDAALGDLDALNRALNESGDHLIIKAHPNEKFVLSRQFSNMSIWPQDVDIYPYLDSVDVLITDYSSVFYDFVDISNGEVWLYIYDYEEYISSSRDLAFPFLDNVSGKVLRTHSELIEAIGSRTKSPPDPCMAALKTRFWGEHALPACEDIVQRISSLADLKHDVSKAAETV